MIRWLNILRCSKCIEKSPFLCSTSQNHTKDVNYTRLTCITSSTMHYSGCRVLYFIFTSSSISNFFLDKIAMNENIYRDIRKGCIKSGPRPIPILLGKKCEKARKYHNVSWANKKANYFPNSILFKFTFTFFFHLFYFWSMAIYILLINFPLTLYIAKSRGSQVVSD